METLLAVAAILAALAGGAARADSDPRFWSTCPSVDPKTIQATCSLCATGNPPRFWWVKKGETCARH